MMRASKAIFYILLLAVTSLIALYFAIKNPITHAHFYVVVEGGKSSLNSISPQGDLINIKPENMANNKTSFFWGSGKNQLRNIAYFTIKTDLTKLEKVSIYHEKDRLLASYNRADFIAQWSNTEQGYKVPANIIISRSLLPKINKVINWRGDLYIMPILLLLYAITALLLGLFYYLFKKNSDFLNIINNLKLYIISNKQILKQEFIFSYLLITVAYIGLAFVNHPFRDDFYRTPNYNNGWLQDGRYLMHFIYQLITVNLNRAVVVATPYTYFASTAFLALASLILARYFNRKNIYVSLIIASLLILLPFYYEDMLYQHERLIMAFSLLWAITIALLSYHLTTKTRLVFTFLGLSSLFLLYQPMLTYYIFMVAILFCLELIKPTHHLKSALVIASTILTSFILTVLFYTISNTFLAGMDKISYASSVATIDSNFNLLSKLNNLITHLYNQWQASFFGYATVIILTAFIILLLKNFINTKPRFFTVILFTVAFIVVLFSPTLIYLLSSIKPHYRFISAINLLLTIALLYLYNYSKNDYLHKASLTMTLLLLMSSLSMIACLNNAMQNIAKHQLELKTLLKEDLYQYHKGGGNLKNLAYTTSHRNIIKLTDNPEKPRYLPAVYYILSEDSFFDMMTIMGFTHFTFLKNFEVGQLDNLPYNQLFDRRYYTIRYYPSLNSTVIDFK